MKTYTHGYLPGVVGKVHTEARSSPKELKLSDIASVEEKKMIIYIVAEARR